MHFLKKVQKLFKIKNRFIKLYISYITILLPIFLVYLFLTQSIISTMKRDIDLRSVAQLEQTQDVLDLWFDTYENTSMLLSTKPELFRYSMLQSEIKASKGIELLKEFAAYNGNLYDLFMYYDNDKIYSSFGLSRTSVYFNNKLECIPDSSERANSILSEPDSGVYYLAQKEGMGYLIYNYPVRWKNEGAMVSANFLIEVSKLMDILKQITKDCDTYIVLSFADGKTLTFYGNNLLSNSLERVSNNSISTLNTKKYTKQSVFSEQTNIEVSAFYEIGVLYQEINTRQIISYIVISVLLLFSMLISYVLSRKYHNPIKQLVNRIANYREKENLTVRKKIDELDYLNNTFSIMLDERSQILKGFDELKTFVKPQIGLMLFHGMVKEPNLISKMLEACESELHENYFLVVAVAVIQNKNDNEEKAIKALESFLNEELFVKTSKNDETVLAFLIGVPTADYSNNYREKLTSTIENICSVYGRTAISFSNIYQNIKEISHAYIEATSGMGSILEGRTKTNILYSEKIASSPYETTMFSNEKFNNLKKAIDCHDEASALQYLNYFTHMIEYNNYSFETKRYLRYSFLEKMIELIKKDDFQNNCNDLFAEIIKIDPANEEQFIEEVTDLIRKMSVSPQKIDEVKKAIRYINQNFCNYELSLDEVSVHVGLSKSYLSKLFKKKTGKKYIDYVSEIRLKEAKKLFLTQPDLTIYEIVHKVGYFDITSFCKKFRLAYGVNPSIFRKTNIE